MCDVDACTQIAHELKSIHRLDATHQLKPIHQRQSIYQLQASREGSHASVLEEVVKSQFIAQGNCFSESIRCTRQLFSNVNLPCKAVVFKSPFAVQGSCFHSTVPASDLKTVHHFLLSGVVGRRSIYAKRPSTSVNPFTYRNPST